MYLGISLLYAGLALLLWSPVAGALLAPLLAIMSFVIIPREEAYLERRFGEEYAAYKRETRRWL
jgi:protein-S-isoprenylcysteine O-methyltransferase Ste14